MNNKSAGYDVRIYQLITLIKLIKLLAYTIKKEF